MRYPESRGYPQDMMCPMLFVGDNLQRDNAVFFRALEVDIQIVCDRPGFFLGAYLGSSPRPYIDQGRFFA